MLLRINLIIQKYYIITYLILFNIHILKMRKTTVFKTKNYIVIYRYLNYCNSNFYTL
jgi:hypothetical protein